MTNPSKKKGTAWEVRLVTYLNEHGFPFAERRVQAGALDKGDIAGLPILVEAKNCRKVELGPWCDEAAKEARTAGMGNRWAVVFPRRSHATAKAYAVISLELLAELMRLARNEAAIAELRRRSEYTEAMYRSQPQADRLRAL